MKQKNRLFPKYFDFLQRKPDCSMKLKEIDFEFFPREIKNFRNKRENFLLLSD